MAKKEAQKLSLPPDVVAVCSAILFPDLSSRRQEAYDMGRASAIKAGLLRVLSTTHPRLLMRYGLFELVVQERGRRDTQGVPKRHAELRASQPRA